MYHALLFFAYCFYPPLCIAGPVVTFNDFATQVVAPPDVPAKQVWLANGAAMVCSRHRQLGGACSLEPLLQLGAACCAHMPAARAIRPQVLAYGARWLLAVGMLEVFTRTLYFHAIAQHKLLDGWVDIDVTSYHFVLTSFWVLVLMWLKVSWCGPMLHALW